MDKFDKELAIIERMESRQGFTVRKPEKVAKSLHQKPELIPLFRREVRRLMSEPNIGDIVPLVLVIFIGGKLQCGECKKMYPNTGVALAIESSNPLYLVQRLDECDKCAQV